MVTYATALAATDKAPVWILEFPNHGPKRYVSSRIYTGLSSAATPGLIAGGTLTAAINLRTGRLDFDDVEVVLVDGDGTVGTFLSTNDQTLQAAACTLKYGFLDVAEADFQSIALYLDDWERVERGYVLHLRTALAYLDRPLFEDFGKDDFTLRSSLAPATMTVDVGGNLTTAKWRAAGYALLSDQQTSEVELVQYSSFAVVADQQTILTVSNRRKFSVGAVGKTWAASTTRVQQAWAYREDPLGMFVRFATTTAGGGNGASDAADGDGLGDLVPAAAIDSSAIFALRPTGNVNGNPNVTLTGVYIGTEPIRSVLEMFEAELLAMGLRFKLTRAGKLSAFSVMGLSTTPTDITGKVVDGTIPQWKRDYAAVENNIVSRWDFNPATSSYAARVEMGSPRSVTRYGKSRLRELKGAGLRGNAGRAYGFPNEQWDVWQELAANAYVAEFANPSASIQLDGFLSAQDIEVGDLVTLTHPGIYDLDTGAIGVTGKAFYVVGVERRPDEARVGLTLRQKRYVSTRLLIIAPNTVADYASATAAEKQYGYIGLAAGNFADGGVPYEIGD